jgi:hypothetical protein
MLDIFAENEIHATWATVGALFCESKDELLESLPCQRPTYTHASLSNYSYLDEIGSNEKSDPYYFAPSLIDMIRKTSGQEIGTHTMSHFYCLEDGVRVEAFEADLVAALKVASRRGINITSIVFPRNQFSNEHLDACRRSGLTAYRGNPTGWAYAATKGSEQTRPRRALRLLDAYTGVLGSHSATIRQQELTDVPASRFLRPCSGRLASVHRAHVSVIRQAMTRAAERGETFHLWWHPHNFGRNLAENLAWLRAIASHYHTLHSQFGMVSASMAECT